MKSIVSQSRPNINLFCRRCVKEMLRQNCNFYLIFLSFVRVRLVVYFEVLKFALLGFWVIIFTGPFQSKELHYHI